jgi:3-oxoacyl-[acyl-carrier protein] reductase
MKLKGKVAIITGGAQGIGRAFALRFAREGANVAVVDLARSAQGLDVEAEIAKAGGKAMALSADVSDEASMRTAADQVAERFGGIDILVNNAGIFQDMSWGDQSLAYLRKVMDVNTLGILSCGRAVLPHMRARGGGAIINMASTSSFPRFIPLEAAAPTPENFPNYAYGLSKSGVVFLTKSMARTAGAYKVRVNAIAPGPTLSEAMRGLGDHELMLVDKSLKRMQEPSELAGTAVFLASVDSVMMTGQTLVVDGGGLMLG